MTQIFMCLCNNRIYDDTSYYKLQADDYAGAISTLGDYCAQTSETCAVGLLIDDTYFLKNDIPLSDTCIEKILDDYHMIIPYEGIVSTQSLIEQYVQLGGCVGDIDIVREMISVESPEYLQAFDFVLNGRTIFKENCFIGRQTLVYEYLNWINALLPRDRDSAIEVFSDKYPILFGWLLKVFLLMHQVKIKSELCERCDSQKWYDARERITILQKYMDTMLGELIELRRRTGFGQSDIIDDFQCRDTFDEKIPVWMCWWQGIEDMPELIRACVASVNQNIPSGYELRIITLDNVSEYVTFTPAIVDKFNADVFSLTHLSDLLRAELLYRYGGIWIDATYFVSHSFADSIFNNYDFYSICFKPQMWDLDIMQGRWTLSLLACKKHDAVIQFLLEAMWVYWEKETELRDYYIHDYCLDTGYRMFPEIRSEIDQIPGNSPEVYGLQMRLNDRCNNITISDYSTKSIFYKINRRNEYKAVTENGQTTLYGYLCNKYINRVEEEIVDSVYNIRDDYQLIIEGHMGTLIDKIRQNNPNYIIDDDMVYMKQGYVSMLTIPEVLPHIRGFVSSQPKDKYLFPLYRQMYGLGE